MVYSLTDELNFDPNSLDGVLAVRNLFGQGQLVRVYPRQIVVLEVSGEKALSFIHGAPDTTALTSAISIQHKRMRRGILERNKVSVPKGATFSMARGLSQAKAFAKKVGFPVVVKASRGDAGFYNFTDLMNQRDVNRAIEKMKVPTHQRSGVFHSGYTPMELGKPRQEKGRTIVPGSYRILVEKQLSGQLIRFLIYDGSILSAVRCEGSPSDGTLISSQDVLSQVHPRVSKVVERAFGAFPHTGVAAIDVVTSDVSLPSDDQDVHVVDFHERPFLWVQAKFSFDLAQALSGTIVSKYLESQGLRFTPTPEAVKIRIRAFSLPSASSSQAALGEIASDIGVEYSPVGHSDLAGTIEGILEGRSFRVAALIDAITNGYYDSVPAGLVEALEI